MRKTLLIIFILFFSSVLRAQVDLTLGLRAYYPFSGNANDVSGNNNNPSQNNATLTADRFGTPNSAYRFNGTSSYMRIPNSATLNMGTQITVCAWVRANGFYQGTCHGNSAVMKGDDDFLTGNYFLRYDDGGFTNYQNCAIPTPDPNHQTFYGVNTPHPGGYTPYIQVGEWYSVIYTSDGTTSKLYVNCVLKVSAPANSIQFTNQYDLFFGRMNHPQYPYWMNGDLDEVRLYNRVLNQAEINLYGGCYTGPPISGVINTYTPVLGLDICENKITVENSTGYNPGDTVLMIQMKGAVIDSSNTTSFGTITDYKNAGKYEFNYIKSKTGNVIEFKNKLTRQYDVPIGKVQLVRVPYLNGNALVTATLTCLPWDGNKGGILVANVKDTLILNADIDVSGNGFRGGNDPVSTPPGFNCNENQFYYPPNPDLASEKGEGIAIISVAKSFGKGALANGGGGGNSHNAGGGGGANMGAGGIGGYQLEAAPCDGTVPFDNRGMNGRSLTYSNAANLVFLGGGGGAGHTNNPEAFQAKGGNGGGIVMIIADKIISSSKKIIANGSNAPVCGSAGSGCHEGMGGGGAAGTILFQVNSFVDNSNVEAKGGTGGNMTAAGFTRVGPGGGGAGGAAWFTNASLPSNVVVTSTGGTNGVCTAYSNDPWGSSAGAAGSTLFNLAMPFDLIPFQKNIDSVRIKDSATSCKGFDFKGLGYTNSNPISTWQWNFGDAGTANTQNTSHTYLTAGTYPVKLLITDINGCKDSITKAVTPVDFTADAGNDTSYCSASPISRTLRASAGSSWAWTPAGVLNNPSSQNPIATISATTKFHVTVTNFPGCTALDSVTITVIQPVTPSATINGPAAICAGMTATFTATITNGGTSPVYQWLKNGNPVGNNSSTYIATGLINADIIKVRLTSNVSCVTTVSVESNAITMTVTAPPANLRYPTLSTLVNQPLQLQARNLGGNSYSWEPPTGLSNALINNPVFNHGQDQEYRISITTAAGCNVVDTQLVKISGKKGIYVPKAFSPNGDGTNDRLYPILVGIQQLYYFRIYNRWGNLLFETNSGSPSSGWDGKFKGSLQPVETYTWVAEGLDITGVRIKNSGNTILLR